MTFPQLYKQFVCCHLEFAVPAWSSWLQEDIETLEKVQCGAINLVVGLRGRTYEEKLVELGMRTLENRRKRLDLAQTFKIFKGIDKVESTIMFITVGDQNLRLARNTAYSNNLIAWRSRTDLRNHFFSNRIVKLWNSIPTDLKDSHTMNIFKAGLEKLNI